MAASRAARQAIIRVAASPASVSPVRCLASGGGEYNPFTHSLDRLNTKKVAQTLDLGDGKTQKIFERIKVEFPPEHCPPMRLSGPVGKITSNLYSYASMNGVLDAVEKDFHLVEKDLIGTKEWLNSNGWTTTQKLEMVNKFMSKAGSLTPFTKELLPYFVEQKMLKHLPEIKDLFFKLVKEKRGEIDVFVTSADPLDAATLKQLEGLIIKQIGSSAASKVNFHTDVDKDLVAGLRIRYKSTLIDNTITRKVSATKDTWAKAYQEAMAL
ncbi:hypothetical protein NSK_008571 [Nannochloropsis salina CCMP1776]|uniref:ATP synthase subunit O, mitochondrial n=1 Tax=Nannochloropsis salina CCMP1776 TaxID=1027361 RepID=A0A4D9CR20_9STRA|nr:hypothetical protein NSK_008571 [Nannochloropsis salina CCMP1776]|eukprot:TFJ80013.1 hypothetical protein NSK_008571 [Nannochloropsis salina CCMP1776]